MMSGHNNVYSSRNNNTVTSSMMFFSPPNKLPTQTSPQQPTFAFREQGDRPRNDSNHQRKALATQSMIFTAPNNNNNKLSGFSKLDSLARHVPTPTYDDFPSQNNPYPTETVQEHLPPHFP